MLANVLRRLNKNSSGENEPPSKELNDSAGDSWWRNYSCVSGNKSPRCSRTFTRSATLPLPPSPHKRQQQQQAQLHYEKYVQATVAANAATTAMEVLMAPSSTPSPSSPPSPPPRRHAARLQQSRTPDQLQRRLATSADSAAADAQTLCNIRQQMALSLKRMRDLEEQVKTIPDLQLELAQLRTERLNLQSALQRKDDELHRARDTYRHSATPSPAASYKSAAPAHFTPQRISPIALESLGVRLRTNSSSSDRPPKPALALALRRDVGVMCALLHPTRSIGVGTAPPPELCSTGCSPVQALNLSERLYTRCELDEHIAKALQCASQSTKQSVSVAKQMFVPKTDLQHAMTQTSPMQQTVSVTAKPTTRDTSVSCKPTVRSVGSSEHRLNDALCRRCVVSKRSVACGTDPPVPTLQQLGRSNTFTLGDNEKLSFRRKTVGTQYTPLMVRSSGAQTNTTLVHNTAVQCSAELQNSSTQYSAVEKATRQTDTCDLEVRSCVTGLSGGEQPAMGIATTEMRSTPRRMRAVQHSPPRPAVRHAACNTVPVATRDFGCGDAVKPHISIACAENFCDSCKDTIRHLAKDFSKLSPTSPLPTHAADSRIPRPLHVRSPSVTRRGNQLVTSGRTLTPSPTLTASPTPLTRAQNDKATAISDTSKQRSDTDESSTTELESLFDPPATQRYKLSQSGQGDGFCDDLIVKEETRVSINWSRDASPALFTDATALKTTPTSTPQPRTIPSAKLRAALKTIEAALRNPRASNHKSSAMKAAKAALQSEWFGVSSAPSSKPEVVRDYLAAFRETSVPLLEYCVNLADANGNTALHYAVSHGNFEIVAALLDSKVCNANAGNNAGYTSVMLACLTKAGDGAQRAVVQRLLQRADVNVRAKKHSQTALMLAVTHGNRDMVALLLEAGAEVNAQDEDGSTALMCAAEHDRLDIVKQLLSHPDCDSLKEDLDGSTAFKIAWQAGHRDIGLLLYMHEQMLSSRSAQRSGGDAVTTSTTTELK